MKKILLVFVTIIAVVIIIPLLIWKLSYIDETVSSGEKYEFVVGENKKEVFNRIKAGSSIEKMVAIQVGNSVKDFKVINLENFDFINIEMNDSLVIMYDADDSFLNTLKLNFKNDKLSNMHRHKQLFELP